MIVAVIPARGGSKRIPRKNVRLFARKPMIAYPIGIGPERRKLKARTALMPPLRGRAISA